MKLFLIRQGDKVLLFLIGDGGKGEDGMGELKLEPWFRKYLVEDKGADGSPSYVDFLCAIHREIRNILS